MQSFYEFAQSMMNMFFVPIFITSLIVAVPLSITRGRIVLKILVGFGGLALAVLILLTIWAPMTLIASYIVFPFLVPAFIAGLVILLMTGAKTTGSFITRTIVSLIIISTPYIFVKEMKKRADTEVIKASQSKGKMSSFSLLPHSRN